MPLTNVFRTDGWVKTAQGPAVPGAQIFVCLQPANIASLPPTPLANIFSDVNGLVPITQPIITDGFGHYDFYTAAGVYTVIVGLAGIVQQVYLDQSIGGASGTQGGGTALVLQVNGAPASSQLLQNLQGAGSVTVSDAGAGNITITGAATVLPVFQTNGVPNTLQSLLNVKQGANISITADGAGGVTINGASSIVSGTNVWPTSFAGFVTSNPQAVVVGGNTWIQMLPGSVAYCTPASWKFTISSISGNTVKVIKAVVAIATAGSLTVNTFNPVTFNGGSTTATFTTTQTSDAINIPIDADHDYYVMIYYDPTSGNAGYWQVSSLNLGAGSYAVKQTGDQTATSPITTAGGSNGNLFKKIVVT